MRYFIFCLYSIPQESTPTGNEIFLGKFILRRNFSFIKISMNEKKGCLYVYRLNGRCIYITRICSTLGDDKGQGDSHYLLLKLYARYNQLYLKDEI